VGRKWLGSAPSSDQDLATKEYVDDAVAGGSVPSHTHDDRYYTETEVDALLANVGGSDVFGFKARDTTEYAVATTSTPGTLIKTISFTVPESGHYSIQCFMDMNTYSAPRDVFCEIYLDDSAYQTLSSVDETGYQSKSFEDAKYLSSGSKG